MHIAAAAIRRTKRIDLPPWMLGRICHKPPPLSWETGARLRGRRGCTRHADQLFDEVCVGIGDVRLAAILWVAHQRLMQAVQIASRHIGKQVMLEMVADTN